MTTFVGARVQHQPNVIVFSFSPRGSWARQRSCFRQVTCRASQELFIFGLGYTGLGLANYFQKKGWEVAGTCRSEEKRDVLLQRGFPAYTFGPVESEDMLGDDALDRLHRATHIISTVPPTRDREQDPVLQSHAHQLAERAQQYAWVGYVSSSSVYGDHSGAWVDETSELRASSGKGFSRVRAEHAWLQLYYEHELPVHLFRCGGIYGPSRSALDAARQQAPPSSTQQRRGLQRYTARCHVLDICRVLEASMARPNPGAAYNLADDDPAGRLEVVGYAAQLLQRQAAGLPLEQHPLKGAPEAAGGLEEQASTAAAGDSNGGSGSSSSEEGGEWRAGLEEKRVRNARIKRELHVRLAFPSYREGLLAIAQGDIRPFD